MASVYTPIGYESVKSPQDSSISEFLDMTGDFLVFGFSMFTDSAIVCQIKFGATW